jgi:hypothetical protein
MYCSPNKNNKDSKTCFSLNSLRKIVRSYNDKNPDSKIRGLTTKSREELWSNIQIRLQNRCNNEMCWIKQDFVKNIKDPEIENYTFRPQMPQNWVKNKYTWLSTVDIQEVMKQYEHKYPYFSFLGPVPYDCPYEITCELTNTRVKKLLGNGIQQMGVIYNLDTHNQPGSHWVAVFLDLTKLSVEYYDSYGVEPPELIYKWMEKMQQDMQNTFQRPAKLKYNQKRHQYGNSECGIFSMNFIIERLKGKTLERISREKITDRKMNLMRRILYRPVNNI